MAEKSNLEGRREKLATYLPFDASETPKWRTKEEVPISEMIRKIMDYRKKWEEAKSANVYDEKLVEKVRSQFLVEFIFHVNMEEEKGFGTFEETEEFLNSFHARGGNLQRPLSITEQETINLRKAYEHLLGKMEREEEESDYGLIESSLLEETHRILMEDTDLPQGKTKPGKFSVERRYVEFNGELYKYPHYPKPGDMETAVYKLLDKYNDMFDLCTKGGLKEFEDFYYLFKTCAWLLFELLDLHPFGNGNGRLCRILCSYLLSKFTPFPTPVYNVWTESRKNDYRQALVDTRKSEGRQPTTLTTMIIECSYYGWGKFFEALEENKAHYTLKDTPKAPAVDLLRLITP
ncbi:uncharacterized protein LOC110057012 isoform X3 [Orbicella faveolata]|uniref:uncharacterized protein LOC110057012 isoform X3 n=1 Tax=Orbicella faveolata TaxID=48498 RepID=UPI0009E39417|nr:uncharacterized protein LOC110057012 isoform X3 [Orbicella faveolata]